MTFSKFIKACDKYRFTFVLNAYNGLLLILRPRNTFDRIEVTESYYSKLFKKAVGKMKKYRKKEGG